MHLIVCSLVISFYILLLPHYLTDFEDINMTMSEIIRNETLNANNFGRWW